MSILRKNIEELTLDDLHELVTVRAQETGELEFKGDLPFKPQKGHPEKADRWIEKGDYVGRDAQNEIFLELIAFANAEGGTLVLGVVESKGEPRRAESLAPLPNCEALAKRLLDAGEDIVQPRLPSLVTRGIPADGSGAGFVVLRVGKSLSGPHRLEPTRDFYVRRGERSEKMTVREIKDLTLDLARTGDRLQQEFSERHEIARDRFRSMPWGGGDQHPPLLVRATALPTTPQTIVDVTSRLDLWWRGNGFMAKVDGKDMPFVYPAREFGGQPRLRLRALEQEFEDTLYRLVRGDGAIEFALKREHRTFPDGDTSIRVYAGWLISLFVGTLCQIALLRRRLAWDAIGYGLEFEIWSTGPLQLRWDDRGWFHSRHGLPSADPLPMPRYAVGSVDEFDPLTNLFITDLMNAFGDRWQEKLTIPWDDLLKAT